MSGKKRRHSRAVPEADRGAQKKGAARWNPAGRAMLYCDLVFLALAVLLESGGLISPGASALCTVIAVVVLIAALWLLFGPGGGEKRPRL